MPPTSRIRPRVLVATAGALALTALTVPAALGADSVTQEVTAGTRTASVADLTLASKAYSHSSQTSTGTMTLTADDSSGSDAGWNVTIQSSAFAHGGSGASIDASNFALSAADAPAMTAGQAVDGTNGPKVPTTSPVGTLDTPRKVVQAEAGYGKGTYTQGLDVTLTIPGQTVAGTYTGTLTTTITAGP